MVNGAFKVYPAGLCGRHQLAIALFKHPPAVVDTLLDIWTEYIESDDYLAENERSRRYRLRS